MSEWIPQETQLGEAIIDLFGLPVKSNGRVDTSEGDKTPLGLGKTILRKVKEHLPDDCPVYLEIYSPHPDGTKVMHLRGDVETLKLGHSLIPGSKLLKKDGTEWDEA